MGFNNAKERRKFEAEWKKLRKQYQEAGFSEESINAMRAFDEEEYRSRRRFEEHNRRLPSEDFAEEDYENANSSINFKSLSVIFDECSFDGRYDWVETVDDPILASKLKQLNESDIELLTLIGIEGYNQREIAVILGCSQNGISKRVIKIKKYLKNI